MQAAAAQVQVPFVEFIGEAGGKDKDELMGNAYALLFPIDWPEPFGTSLIKSMACPAPVIAWKNGSVPEVLADGGTGFVVETIDEAVKAVAGVADLSRHACRAVFEERFDAHAHGAGLCEGVFATHSQARPPCRISAQADSGGMETTEWPTLSIS